MSRVIILHGWDSKPSKWEVLGRFLKESGVDVSIPNLPGFKEPLERPWDLGDYASWLDGLIGEEKVFLVGHSFGGGLSVKYTSLYPEKVEGVVLMGAAVVRDRGKRVLLMAAVSRLLKKFSFIPGYDKFRKFIYYYILKRPDYIQARGHLKQTLRNVVNEDLTPLLSKMKKRALIVWGDEDEMTSLEEAKDIRDRMRNSKLEVFKGAGHLIYRDVDQEVLGQKILKFIR